MSKRLRESGNVFMMLMGAVGMVGVVGASSMTVMKGPVKTMAQVTKLTVAENNMIATAKLALIGAATIQANDGDCDNDLVVEPLPFDTAIAGTGGGTVPNTIGTTKQDPWGTDYAYCVWDHGINVDDAGCGGAGQNRLRGANVQSEFVVAVISAGPDATFETTCNDYVDVAPADGNPDTPLVVKTSGADDIILGYAYDEATAMSGGLWGLKDSDTAEISKDLEVTDSTGTAQLQFDSTAGDLTITNAGNIPNLNTDFVSSLNNAVIDVSSPINSDSNILTTANVTVGGTIIANGVGTIRDTGGGWVRTYGDTGWYSQTHGGGWRMTDTTYIRAYNNKSVYNATNIGAPAIYGYNTGTNYGLRGRAAGTYAIYGKTDSASHGGVIGYAQNNSTYGILGYNNAWSFYGNSNTYTAGYVRGDQGFRVGGTVAIDSSGRVRGGVPTCTGAQQALRFNGTSWSCGTISGFSGSGHGHSNYASSGHGHSGYASSGHGHSGYASSGHSHGGGAGAGCGCSCGGCGDDGDDFDDALEDLIFKSKNKESLVEHVKKNRLKGLIN